MNTMMNWLRTKTCSFLRRMRFDSVRARRSGVTLAEALVLIIVAGNLMVPVIGTLHNGIERTNRYTHQDRMRTIAQGEMAKILTEASFMRLPVVGYIATKTWPINDPNPIATYVMEIEALENIQLATLTSTVTGDFPDPDNVVGTQPSNLKAVVITVTNISDGEDPTNPMQIRMYSMVAIPRSFNPNRIYVSDKDNICIYSIDPKTRNVVETFPLPKQNPNINASNNKSSRPGNIAVHPNTNWVLTQRELSLLLTDVAIQSPTRRSSIQVYATTTTFLEDPTDNEKIRKDRGVAFRPDGAFCYATSHSPAALAIFSVPKTFGQPFNLERSFPLSTAKFTDLQVGNDGYIYIGDYDNTGKCFKRLNMYTPPSQAILEDYALAGWTTSPNKKAIAACPSRDGRDVYSVWEGGYVTVSSSSNPNLWKTAHVDHSTNPGGEDLQDIQITGDNAAAIISSKKGGGNTRIFGLPLPLQMDKISPWSAPSQVAYPGDGEVTNQAVLSPTMNEVWIDRKSAGVLYALDREGMLAGSYTSSIASDRVITFLPNGDAGCVAANPPELVAVGCSGINSIEFIDPYSKFHYEDLRQSAYYGTPRHIAFDGTGSRLSVCYDQYSTLPTEHDVFGQKRLADIDPEAWGATVNRRPTHHVYYQNGGKLIQKYGNSVSLNGYVSVDRNGMKQADEDFPLTASMSDVVALNDGGALVLVTDIPGGTTRLDRIGPDAKIWTRWDSRFDNFPPHGATRMAVSPDDSLLALYIPTIGGNPEQVQIFDLRTNDFGNLTQQNGLITDYRLSERSFAGGVPAGLKMSGGGIKLTDTFTINDPVSNMANYPSNFAYTAANKYAGNTGDTRSARFFGYLRIPYDVQTMGLWNRDASQVFIGTSKTPILGTLLDAYTAGAAVTSPVGFTDAASRWIQLDHTSDNPQSDMAPFYSLLSGGTATTGTQDYGVSGITALSSGNSADWKRIPANYTTPLRFTPQNIGVWENPSSNTNPNRIFLCYARDVASPTLWVFNAESSRLLGIPFGGNLLYSGLIASIGADLSMGMAITPDGQRLLIAAASPNRVYMVDVSTPVQSSFMKVIDHIELSQPPTCIAARPFARVNSGRDTYQVVANLPQAIGGNNQAAVASGGIYFVGAQSAIFGNASKKIFHFDPLQNLATDKGDKLRKAVRDHAVFSYDGTLYTMNGFDSTAATSTSWIQSWNPTTNVSSSSSDPAGGGSSVIALHPSQTSSTAPYTVTDNGGIVSGYAGWMAFDGSTGFGDCWGYSGSSSWVRMRFPNPVKVNCIGFDNDPTPDNAAINDFKVSGSNDGSTWTPIYTGNANWSATWKDYPFTSCSSAYTYLQLDIISNDGYSDTLLREAQFKLVGLRKLSPTLAGTTPTVTHSAAESGKDGWHLFDGLADTTNEWDTNTGIPGAWVCLDLGTPDIIDVIRLKHEADSDVPQSFKLQGSNDGATFTDIYTFTNWPKTTNWHVSGFNNSTPYRYYRLYILTTYGGATDVDIQEVEYYSTTPTTPAGVVLEKNRLDDATTEVKRLLQGGAMTPYGYILGGGAEIQSSGGDRSTCQVYWPHVIASYTSVGNLSFGLPRELPSLQPVGCHGLSFVYHKGYLYQIGGASWGGALVGGISRFDFSSNTWTALSTAADTDSLTDPDNLTMRYLAGACSFGDEIFIFGGAKTDGTPINTPIAWNPTTKLVRKLRNIPTSAGTPVTDAAPAFRTVGMTAIPCGSAIYLFGGSSTVGSGGSSQVLKYIP